MPARSGQSIRRFGAPHLLGRAASIFSIAIAAAGLSAIPGEARAAASDPTRPWQSTPTFAPEIIEVGLDSDLPIYDLCWSNHQDAAREQIISQILAAMIDPSAMYVIDVPQITPAWAPISRRQLRFDESNASDEDIQRHRSGRRLTGLSDMNGDYISRDRLRQGKRTYQRDAEEALVECLLMIEERRPGATIAIKDFHCVPRGRRSGCRYEEISQYTNFVFCGSDHRESVRQETVQKVLRRLLGKKVEKELARRGSLALYCHENVWHIASTGALPDLPVEPDPALETEWTVNHDEEGHALPPDPGEPASDPQDPPDSDPPVSDPPTGDPPAEDPPVEDPPVEDPPAPDPPDGGGGGGGEEPDPDEIIIELPSRSEAPYGSQWGPQSRSSLIVFPPEYQARTAPVVRWPLSNATIALAERTTNPRGWTYRDIETQGFDVLEETMQRIHDLGFREVWFFGWSGQHPFGTPFTIEMMPWFSPDAHTPIMRSSWVSFRDRWTAQGMTFGYYLGGCVTPNHGTIQNPDLRPLTRADFDHFTNTLVAIRNEGFESIGMDAYKWILNRLDQPEGRNWADWVGYPARDQGIGWAITRAIKDHPQLQGVYFAAEKLIPYGKYLGAMPALFNVSSRAQQSGNIDDVDTIAAKPIEDTVNPGNEIVAMLMGTGWSRSEYLEARQKLGDHGYRMCVALTVLTEAGYMD